MAFTAMIAKTAALRLGDKERHAVTTFAKSGSCKNLCAYLCACFCKLLLFQFFIIVSSPSAAAFKSFQEVTYVHIPWPPQTIQAVRGRPPHFNKIVSVELLHEARDEIAHGSREGKIGCLGNHLLRGVYPVFDHVLGPGRLRDGGSGSEDPDARTIS